MIAHDLPGLAGDDPLGFLAALGLLRLVAQTDRAASLHWQHRGRWTPRLTTSVEDLAACLFADLDRWQDHPALEGADLKWAPEDFRARALRATRDGDAEELAWLAAYGTGVATAADGQGKPTGLHFTAGPQAFLTTIRANLVVLASMTGDELRAELRDALQGPGHGHPRARTLGWRAGLPRNVAVQPNVPLAVPAMEWLAFLALPWLPTAAVGRRLVTTGLVGRGRSQALVWPLWTAPLESTEVRALIGRPDLEALSAPRRAAMRLGSVYRADVRRTAHGYGAFDVPRAV